MAVEVSSVGRILTVMRGEKKKKKATQNKQQLVERFFFLETGFIL